MQGILVPWITHQVTNLPLIASPSGDESPSDCLRYDKGETNGAPFVYYSAELMAAGGAAEGALMDYACTVLDALGWR